VWFDDKKEKEETFALQSVPILAGRVVTEDFPHTHGPKAKIVKSMMEFEYAPLGDEFLAPERARDVR
jgi:hypothetical protein